MPPKIGFRDVHTRQRDRTHPQRERTSQTRRRNTESDTTAAQQAVEDHVQDRAVRAVPMLCFRSAFPTCHAFAIPPVDLIDDGPSDAEIAARVSECRERSSSSRQSVMTCAAQTSCAEIGSKSPPASTHSACRSKVTPRSLTVMSTDVEMSPETFIRGLS